MQHVAQITSSTRHCGSYTGWWLLSGPMQLTPALAAGGLLTSLLVKSIATSDAQVSACKYHTPGCFNLTVLQTLERCLHGHHGPLHAAAAAAVLYLMFMAAAE